MNKIDLATDSYTIFLQQNMQKYSQKVKLREELNEVEEVDLRLKQFTEGVFHLVNTMLETVADALRRKKSSSINNNNNFPNIHSYQGSFKPQLTQLKLKQFTPQGIEELNRIETPKQWLCNRKKDNYN